MIDVVGAAAAFPRPLTDYPVAAGDGLVHSLIARVEIEPFNVIATGIFVLAIFHTFAVARFTALAHSLQHRHDAAAREQGRRPSPSVLAELMHFLGEVEVVFGLWAVVLMVAITGYAGWGAGQLEGEADEGAWLTLPATADQVFTADLRIWSKLMTSLTLGSEIDPKRIPDDPSVN